MDHSDLKSHLQSLPLDSSLLVLNPDVEEFFKVEAGIQDTEELKKHLVQVQEEAYKVIHHMSFLRTPFICCGDVALCSQIFPYTCIRGFRFVTLKIVGMPAYPRVFELLKDRSDAIFLDIGCCSTHQP